MPAILVSRARLLWSTTCAIFLCVAPAMAEPNHEAPAERRAPKATDGQAKLEASLAKMLSGATLEGSFTLTGDGKIADKLSREKYTLGEVKKLTGDLWQIPARIQYGEKDITLPIVLPIKWAGDTPMVAVNSLPLPGFGAVSARVIFFDGHYAGYWKHGDHGGHLFGVIHPAEKAPAGKSTDESSRGSRRQRGEPPRVK